MLKFIEHTRPMSLVANYLNYNIFYKPGLRARATIALGG